MYSFWWVERTTCDHRVTKKNGILGTPLKSTQMEAPVGSSQTWQASHRCCFCAPPAMRCLQDATVGLIIYTSFWCCWKTWASGSWTWGEEVQQRGKVSKNRGNLESLPLLGINEAFSPQRGVGGCGPLSSALWDSGKPAAHRAWRLPCAGASRVHLITTCCAFKPQWRCGCWPRW